MVVYFRICLAGCFASWLLVLTPPVLSLTVDRQTGQDDRRDGVISSQADKLVTRLISLEKQRSQQASFIFRVKSEWIARRCGRCGAQFRSGCPVVRRGCGLEMTLHYYNHSSHSTTGQQQSRPGQQIETISTTSRKSHL